MGWCTGEGRGGESGRVGPGGESVVLEGSWRPEAAALAELQGVQPLHTLSQAQGAGDRVPAGGSQLLHPGHCLPTAPTARGMGRTRQRCWRGQACGLWSQAEPSLFPAVCPQASGFTSLCLSFLIGEAPDEAQRPCPQVPGTGSAPWEAASPTPAAVSPSSPEGWAGQGPAACDENRPLAEPGDAGGARCPSDARP